MAILKNEQEIQTMQKGGRILASVLFSLKEMAVEGVSGLDLEKSAREMIKDKGAEPAFLGYGGGGEPFPTALCVSVNNKVVHGVPDKKPFQRGDVVSLDLGLKFEGFYTDMAVSLLIGPFSKKDDCKRQFIETSYQALQIGIANLRVGGFLGDVGNSIEQFVKSRGYSVVRELCGHGIGRDLHEAPQIPNYGEKGTGEKIKEGMTICLEPMIVMGDWRLKKSNDGFAYETIDGSLACHFEHTIAILNNKAHILTTLGRKPHPLWRRRLTLGKLGV